MIDMLIAGIAVILAFVGGLVVGGSIVSIMILSALDRKIARSMNHKIPEVVQQLGRCHKFIANLPIKDQRAIKLIRSNQRVLTDLEDDINERVSDV